MEKEEIKQHVCEFADWMQRYALCDYSKKPYKYTNRQQLNSGRKFKTDEFTASQLYDVFLAEKETKI